MPIFSALLSVMFYGERLGLRSLLGVLAATGGMVLLLWHEVAVLSGTPWGVLCALLAAATWALGMRQMRATRIPATTLTLSFWMACMTVLALTLLSWLFERDDWVWPTPTVWGSVGYNAVLAFGFAATTQIILAKDGRLVLVGVGGGELVLSLAGMIFRPRSVIGSMTGNPQDLRDVAALAKAGKLKSLPITRMPKDQANAAVMALSEGRAVGRIVLV